MNSPLTKTLYVNGVIVGEVPATGDHDKDMEAMRQFLKGKGLHKEVTKVQAMFWQAISFSTTAAHLYRQDLSKTPRNGLSIAPFVVNSAFSIELYLKTLHELQSTSPRKEHHLLKLYDGLTVATRDVVVRHAFTNGDQCDAAGSVVFLGNTSRSRTRSPTPKRRPKSGSRNQANGCPGDDTFDANRSG